MFVQFLYIPCSELLQSVPTLDSAEERHTLGREREGDGGLDRDRLAMEMGEEKGGVQVGRF